MLPRTPSELTAHGIADLRYRLIVGQADLEPLRILARRSLVWQGWEVCPMILGASHAVVFRRDGDEYAELLTCTAAPREAAESATVRTLLSMPSVTEAQSDFPLPGDWLPGAKGTVYLARFDLAGGDELHAPFAPGSTLSWDFPGSDKDPGAMPPRTRIGWRATERSLEIETVHTYPEEGCGIRSHTRIEIDFKEEAH